MKRQLSLLLELKKMTQNYPATKEMGKPFMLFYLAAGSVPIVEAMAKQMARKRKQTGRGEATKRKRNSCQIRPFSLHYALRLDESRQSQFIAKIMGTSLAFLQTTWLSFMILCCWRKNGLCRGQYIKQLLVCTWRHGGHVGGQEQKHFSPLGTKLKFSCKFFKRKNSIVLTPNATWPPCYVVADQEYI